MNSKLVRMRLETVVASFILLAQNFPGEIEKIYIEPVRRVSLLAKNQTENLKNMMPECYPLYCNV